MDLFSHNDTVSPQNPDFIPLAERLRPRRLEDFVGQTKHADAKKPLIRNLREKNFLPNLILWGPPGTGKTTFAKLLSQEAKARLQICNAVDTGAKDLKEIGQAAHHHRLQYQEKTIVFIDEIHRLNKAQQDVLLPYTEKGDIVLIGATTENPSYELNSALLSRSQVLRFERLQPEDLIKILKQGADHFKVTTEQIFETNAVDFFIEAVDGDGRKLLNYLEIIFHLYQRTKLTFPLSLAAMSELDIFRAVRYDKNRDEHYDTISAFIKSVRGSDPDAAVYYLARMLKGGEDPVFIARRLVILASEDIGNADPKALPLAMAAAQAVELIGMPEARIPLAQVATYLASCPKSNRAYLAIESASAAVEKMGTQPIPLALRSAQNSFTKKMGHGQNYKYSHDFPKGYAPQSFLPESLVNEKFYQPTEHGFEKNIKAYLEWLRSESKASEPKAGETNIDKIKASEANPDDNKPS